MSWFNKSEQKLERFAIPELVRIIGGFQLLVFVLISFNESLYELLIFDPDLILKGEVWRLVTYVFIPRTFHPIWIIFAVLILWMIGEGLEREWGSLRVNFFVIGCLLSTTIACFALRFAIGVGNVGALGPGTLLYYALFLSFAVIYPDHIINLFLVLPVKIKYLAFVLGGYLLLCAFESPIYGALILCSMLPFTLFATPLLITALQQRSQVAGRRQELRRNSLPIDEAFHRCHNCGKTEGDDPHLEFRVASDDEEYCFPCLAAKKAQSETTS